MIQIYSAGNETFTKNGDAVLWCYACNLSVELNGTWYIDLTAPIDKEGRWKLITEESVLKVTTFQEDEQLYRIKKVTKTDTVIQAVAYPIFYDSADDAFLLDVRPTNKTGQQALDIMCAGTPYSGESNITTANTAYFVRRNLLNAINGNDDPTFMSRWGGEVLYDNYKVIINTRVGGDYGMEARYGRNINGVTYIVDTSNLVTRIVPVAFNGHTMSGSSPWVDSTHINAYAKVYTKEMVFENIRMAEDASGAPDDAVICNNQQELEAALTAAAQAEFATGIDTPIVTMDLDMAMITNMASEYTEPLQDSDGVQIQDNYGDDIKSVWYREYATLEKVRLGDTVRCRDSRIDVASVARVIALTWDCITKKVVHVTLGDFQFNYMKNLSQTMNRVKNVLADDGSLVAERVKGFLDGSQTQLRTQYNLATRQDTMAILFENLDEDSPMYGALGIGTQGICISKTRTADGRDWDWTTGITANGLNTGIGVFGLLTDQTGTNWWNLDTGEFVMGAGSTIGGKTISQYMADAHNELAAYEASNDAVIADIQAQLDGAIESYFYDYEPTLNNYPANEWTTEALKEQHQGDMFYDKSTGNSYRFFKDDATGTWAWNLITDTVATQAMALASAAKDTADGKRRTFVAQPVPPYDAGDVWYTGTEIKVCVTSRAAGSSYAAADWQKKDAYTDNSALNEFIDGAFADLVESNDEKIETFYQTGDPSTAWTTTALKNAHKGDIWQNSSTQKSYRWNGTAWQEMTTTPPSTVMDTIDGKAQIWRTQPTPPYHANDLWTQGSDGDILTCVQTRLTGTFQSADWEKRNKYTDNSVVNQFINTTYTNQMADLQAQLDQKVETWYQPTDPSTAWTRTETDVVLQDSNGQDLLDSNGQQILTTREVEKWEHTGDLWHRTTDSTEWRWSGGGWVQENVPDEIFDQLDGKSSIFTTSSAPSGAQENDLWFRGPNYPIYTMVNGSWVEYNKYTSDENLDEFVDVTFTPWKQETDRNVQTILTNLDGEIIAAVIDGNIINAINISSEGIAINASKLNINGVTSINNGFKVKTDGSFEANSGSIGQIHVTSTAIYSGSHSTYNSSSQGFYLDKDGKFGIGDGTTFMRWNGSSLDLMVSSLSIGGNTAATQSYASDAATSAKNQAISTAASDATTKASNAKSQAISAAAADATTKANSAISTAAADATSKANNAISTAAADATTKANNAKTQAISAAAADATSKANEAAKTATNYLYYDSSVGLVVSTDGTNYASSYNTRVKADGIRFYNKTNLLGELTGTALKFYYNGTQRMQLNYSGITFYKPDGSTTAASVTTDGFVLGTGTIAGFTFGSDSILKGTIGAANSVMMSSGSSAYASIGGSANINGWAFTAGDKFGVTKAGKLYATDIYATAGTIGSFSMTSSTLSYGTWLASGSFWIVPEGKSGSINGSSQSFALTIGSTFGVTTAGGLHAAAGRISGLTIAGDKLYSGSKSAYNSGNQGFCFESNGNFGVGDSTSYIRWNGTAETPTLEVSGQLQMKTGSSISIQNGGTTVFAVSSAGALTAKSGTIGGFTIESNYLHYGSSSSSSKLWLYPNGYSSAISINGTSVSNLALILGSNFGVTRSGAMYAKSGQIGAWNITQKGLEASGNSYFQIGEAKLSNIDDAFVVRYGMHVYADNSELSDGAKQIKFYGLSPYSSGGYIRFAQDGATIAYSSSSSRRYKEVGRKLTSKDIEAAYNVEVRMAKYKKGYLAEDDERCGKYYPMFIAEQVEEFLPDAIDHRDGKTESWNERVMIPIMFQMLKEQKKEIEELRSLINQKGIA